LPNLFVLLYSVTFDPLGQFQVTKTFFTFGLHGYNNFAFMLLAAVAVFLVLLCLVDSRIENTYNYVVQSIFKLVSSIARENIYLKRHIYVYQLLYLFSVILLVNLFGLLPFSFTVTSSFVATLFLSATYFIAVNIIGTSRHG
jgi:F-type H+-transporting ATPase subunit a